MHNDIEKQIAKLKEELRQKREKIQDLKELIKKEIDRDFPLPLEDFSGKELESRMDEFHSLLDRSSDPVPDKTSIASHRKGIGKAIVWGKRVLLRMTKPYVTLVLGKQKFFNQKSLALYQSLILHQKKYQERINDIEERLGECEVLLRDIIKKLQEMAKNSGRAGSDN